MSLVDLMKAGKMSCRVSCRVTPEPALLAHDRLRVAPTVAGAVVRHRRHRRRLHHRLRITGEAVPGVAVWQQHTDVGRSVKPVRVIALEDRVRTGRAVVGRTDPLGGIDHAALRLRQDLAARHRLRCHSDVLDNLRRSTFASRTSLQKRLGGWLPSPANSQATCRS